MDFPSPIFSPRYRSNQQSNYQSPFSSPGSTKPNSDNGSPDFIPFTYSSPLKKTNLRDRIPRRYFNASNGSANSSGSSYSPFSNRQNRNNRGGRNSPGSSQSPHISLYFDPSMLEDPWAELEKELSSKKCPPIEIEGKEEPLKGND